MKRDNWKIKFKKWLGIGVASAVLASGLTVITPTAVMAVETPINDLPEKVSLEVESTTATEVTLKATTDKAIETSTSTLSLFKSGTTTSIGNSTSGTVHTFTVPRPTTLSYEQYKVTVAGLSSNLITVHSNTTGTWELSITPNINTFKTQDTAPIITWTTNRNVKDVANTGVYITEKATGAVLYKVWNATTTGSSPITKFYTEPNKEYIAYVLSLIHI